MKPPALLTTAIFISVIAFVSLQFVLKPLDNTKSIPLNNVVPKEERVNLPIGRHFMIGHWANTPLASTTDLLVTHQLGGIIIMSAPTDVNEIKQWTKTWQEAVDYPLIIAIDQEGGEVSRLHGDGFSTQNQRSLNNIEEAYELGEMRGQELADLGINMNMAPVIDFSENKDSFMFARSFQKQDQIVPFAQAMIDGMKSKNVIATPKHFPGHPDNNVDSHLELPTLHIKNAEIDNYLTPWRELIKPGKTEAIMTAHVLVPNIDNQLPATLSSLFLTKILRDDLEFEGLIITDDMSMDAIDKKWSTAEASRMSLEAGSDIVLFAAVPQEVTTAIETIKQHPISTSSVQSSDARLQKVTTTSFPLQ